MRETVFKGQFNLAKSDDDNRLAFGWASIAKTENGTDLIDFAGDIISPEELEAAAYDFVLHSRDGGEMHTRGGVATLVESVVFTKEKMTVMGIPDGTLPSGWWVGFYVTDEDVWQKVKGGEYPMFSIEGTARSEEE